MMNELVPLIRGESEQGKVGGDPGMLPHAPRRPHKCQLNDSGLKNQLRHWFDHRCGAIKLILFRANSNQISRRQHCMKWSEDRGLLRAYTQTWLSVRISKVQPWNWACHNFKDTRMVSNSNWLMFSFLAAMKGGNGAWKNSPKQTAPQASRQASHTNESGLETVTFFGITETPL